MTRSPRLTVLAVLATVLSVTVGVVASPGKPGHTGDLETTKSGGHGGKRGSIYTISGDTVSTPAGSPVAQGAERALVGEAHSAHPRTACLAEASCLRVVV